jgi:hypothetical protein
MAVLLDEIIRVAQDDRQSLPNLLRSCVILASELRDERLKKWANQELDGYRTETDVPHYRVHQASAYGQFEGRFQRQYSRHLIPSGVLPEELRHWGETVNVSQSAGSLHDLARDDLTRGVIIFPWPPNMIAHYSERLVVDCVCHNAWQELPKSALIEILEAVRNTTLRMALEIRESVQESGSDLAHLQPEVKTEVQQIIIHNLTNLGGNVSLRDIDASGQTVIVAGDRKSLDAALTKAGMNQTDLAELTDAIQVDGNKAGTRVSKWIGDKAHKMLIGGVKIGASIAQKVLTEMLMQHYGLKM